MTKGGEVVDSDEQIILDSELENKLIKSFRKLLAYKCNRLKYSRSAKAFLNTLGDA